MKIGRCEIEVTSILSSRTQVMGISSLKKEFFKYILTCGTTT